ncbi:hypothetical protein [Arthrobacter sp. Leaf137]|uniref:hypothetical protein n=1 Tax=Arthrobacter sp. Leaf137 TaxID=1736271 RepID=UPI0006F34230|nr:hypothetical protein [Arthrobacter sp. Leaf137]KQQ81458.1 hypothetical protein ASF64_12230 [Arthrobacter sp. Leaf137]
MTETATGDTRVLEEAGGLEQVRAPAWETKYELGENPEDFAHMVCCRDLDWRKAICGYVEENPTIMHHSHNICTMCVETAESMGVVVGERQCPIDDQPCPPDEEVDRMIEERTSRA